MCRRPRSANPFRAATPLTQGQAAARIMGEHNAGSEPFIWTRPAGTILGTLSRMPASSIQVRALAVRQPTAPIREAVTAGVIALEQHTRDAGGRMG